MQVSCWSLSPIPGDPDSRASRSQKREAGKGKGKKLTVSQLTNTDETRHILIKHLETATILLGLARITETTRAVEDLQEGIEVD
jgi:hypothetical protein